MTNKYKLKLKKGLPSQVKITIQASSRTEANKLVGRLERHLKMHEELIMNALENPCPNLALIGYTTVSPVKASSCEELKEFCETQLKLRLNLVIERSVLHFILN